MLLTHNIDTLTYLEDNKKDIIDILKETPHKHTIIFVKNKLRQAKTLFPEGLNNHKNIGIMYDNGYGVKINHKKANIYYKLAAEQGHMNALYNLALSYGQGQGVKKNYVQSLKRCCLGQPDD